MWPTRDGWIAYERKWFPFVPSKQHRCLGQNSKRKLSISPRSILGVVAAGIVIGLLLIAVLG
jgi:hypothetical protein